MDQLKLSPAQKSALKSAIQRGGQLNSYGINSRTIEILEKHGYIQQDDAIRDKDLWGRIRQKQLECIFTAKALLVEHADNWPEALQYLVSAQGYQRDLAKQVYWVTEQARMLAETL